jgi:AraC-like DNA-binding protein
MTMNEVVCDWHLEGPFEGLPELKFFQFAHVTLASFLAEHVHEDAFEFVFIEKGKASWQMSDLHFETRAGDVFHTQPNESHKASYNFIEPCRLWALMIQPPMAAKGYRWLELLEEEIQFITKGLYMLPRIINVGVKPLELLRRLAKIIQTPGPSPRLEGRIILLELLLLLLKNENRIEFPQDTPHLKTLKIANDLAANPAWKPAVSKLAARVGVSEQYFYKIFQQVTQLRPKEYIDRIRIKEACRLLESTDKPVTHIALDLGYSSSQHFSVVFKRLTGKTPTQWRVNNEYSGH